MLAVAVVRFTGTSPRNEITGMLDQMRGGQSAVSRRPDRRQSDASLFATNVTYSGESLAFVNRLCGSTEHVWCAWCAEWKC